MADRAGGADRRLRHQRQVHRRASRSRAGAARGLDLSAVRAILSTGSPLLPESFEFVYEDVKRDVQLSSISGGTDIVLLLRARQPGGPGLRGRDPDAGPRPRGRGLGRGRPPGRRARRASWSARKPFPSMPVMFWNDPDGSRYRNSYFARFPGVWAHGDYAELTEHEGVIIYGRSDAVLNPGGVRIGTAEIYRQVEQVDEVVEAIVRRPGLAGRRAGGPVRAAARRAGARQGPPGPPPPPHPRERLAAARAGADHPGRGHPAHALGQDHRAGGAGRDPRPAGQEHARRWPTRRRSTSTGTCRSWPPRRWRCGRATAGRRSASPSSAACRPSRRSRSWPPRVPSARSCSPAGYVLAVAVAGGLGYLRLAELGRFAAWLEGLAAGRATSEPAGLLAERLARPARAMGEAIRAQAGEISAQGATLAAVIEALPDPVLIADRGLQVVRANAAARRQFAVGQLPLPLARVLRDPGVLAAVEGGGALGRRQQRRLLAHARPDQAVQRPGRAARGRGARARRADRAARADRGGDDRADALRLRRQRQPRDPQPARRHPGHDRDSARPGAGRPARARHVPRPHGRRGGAHGAARRRPAVALADRARRPPAADRALRSQGRARAGRGADVRGRGAGQGPARDPLPADAARGRGRRGPAAPARRQPRRQRDQVRRRGQDRDGRGGGARRRAR